MKTLFCILNLWNIRNNEKNCGALYETTTPTCPEMLCSSMVVHATLRDMANCSETQLFLHHCHGANCANWSYACTNILIMLRFGTTRRTETSPITLYLAHFLGEMEQWDLQSNDVYRQFGAKKHPQSGTGFQGLQMTFTQFGSIGRCERGGLYTE